MNIQIISRNIDASLTLFIRLLQYHNATFEQVTRSEHRKRWSCGNDGFCDSLETLRDCESSPESGGTALNSGGAPARLQGGANSPILQAA